VLWELTRQRFDEMTLQYPIISHKVMMNLSRGLSERLRRTTENLRAASANSDFNAISGVLLPGQTERRRHTR
jgi:CRP-like cAMP-binding protein